MSPRPLLVIVPSRERPGNAERLISAFRLTSAGYAELLVAVDEDDPTVADYPPSSPGVQVVVGPPGNLSSITNRHAVGSGRFAVGSIGDDHVPLSKGWDERVVGELLELGSGFVYGDDGFHGERLPTACFVTADVVDALGWFCLPSAEHLFVDRVWLELGRRAGAIRFLPDVRIDHCHPAAGKAASDESYERSNSSERWSADRAAFRTWLASAVDDDVETIRALPSLVRAGERE